MSDLVLAAELVPASAVAKDAMCAFGMQDCTQLQAKILTVVQIIFADIILSGDNALVIGMAAAGVAPQHRRLAIVTGLALAAFLRIVFTILAAYLLAIPGILLVGGLLLAWVCVRFYKDLRGFHARQAAEGAATAQPSGSEESPRRRLFRSLVTITVADVSMSIDNVLAIAAIAREDKAMLAFGLILAIVLMAFCATIIMKLLTRFPLLSWAGLVFLVYLTLVLLYEGGHQVADMLF